MKEMVMVMNDKSVSNYGEMANSFNSGGVIHTHTHKPQNHNHNINIT